MLHHALAGPSSPASNSSTNIRLRAEDNTSAGDNLTFLQSKLTWDQGSDGRERVLDADGNGVMMGWEEPLSNLYHLTPLMVVIEHLRLLTQGRDENLSVLNVGYGLGIVSYNGACSLLEQIDRLLQATKPRRHIIMEAHPDVLQHMRKQGVYDWPNVHILEGRWQDWLQGEKISEVIELSDGGFDSIFVDTFAEGYEGEGGALFSMLIADLKAFFEVLPDILEAENGRFSFWNGLGATSEYSLHIIENLLSRDATIYAVSCGLAELHLEDVGLSVEWTDVPIPESQRSEVWKGVKRRYWDLPGYRLPVGKMQLI